MKKRSIINGDNSLENLESSLLKKKEGTSEKFVSAELDHNDNFIVNLIKIIYNINIYVISGHRKH